MIKVCIFDLDGTLARTQASIARPVNMTLAYYGLPEQPVEAFNYFAGDGIKNALIRALKAAGVVKNGFDAVKVLGNGKLDKKLTVKVSAFSESAKAAIEAAGGKAEVV